MNSILTDFPPLTTYEMSDPSGVSERLFEELSIRILRRLYPQCSVFPFRPNVRHEDAIWQPDVAVVDNAGAFWFVVEVEIATHHLEKHVLPQVTAFAEGAYSDNAAVQLATSLKIEKAAAQTLLNLVPREVAVVCNKHDEQWITKLRAGGVQFMSIATYRNLTTNQAVHHVQGELAPSVRSLGFGTVRAVDGAVLIKAGTFWKEGEYNIVGPDGIATWICSITEGHAWLMKSRGLIEFHDKAVVQFLLRNDNSVLIRMPYPD